MISLTTISNLLTYLSPLFVLTAVLLLTYFAARGVKYFFLKTAVVLISWLVLVYGLAQFGFFQFDHLIAPNIILGFIVLFGILKKVYDSKAITEVANKLSLPWLMGIQFSRIGGISFLILYYQGILPAMFAFPAGYGDILVGITAPVVGYLYYKKKMIKLAYLWNVVGIIDLFIAISIGILGYPIAKNFLETPFQVIASTPSTDPLAAFPLVLIPLFLVPLAILLHFFALRILKKKKI